MNKLAFHDTLDSEVALARRHLVGERDMFSPSEIYHENSKITATATHFGVSADAASVAASGFKRYQHAALECLPPPRPARAELGEVVVARQSCRVYDGRPLVLEELSDLLFLTLGAQSNGRRCVPSAGGLYPLELYVAVSRVEALAPGVLHYDVRAHGLRRLATRDPAPAIRDAIFIPEALDGAAAVFLISALFGRSKIKYGERAYRFALLEAGHAMQNLLLVATGLGLGGCPVGGFIDDRLHDVLDIDGVEEAALYAAVIGRQA